MYKQDSLMFDPVSYALALTFTNDAFDGLDSPDALCEQRIPQAAVHSSGAEYLNQTFVQYHVSRSCRQC
jgi:hypothetical protein